MKSRKKNSLPRERKENRLLFSRVFLLFLVIDSLVLVEATSKSDLSGLLEIFWKLIEELDNLASDELSKLLKII